MIKRGRWVVAAAWVLGLVSTARAEGTLRWNSGPPPPLHPTIIEGTYKDKTLPIVSVAGDTPMVEVDGKLKSLSSGSKTRYTPARGAHYAPGSLTLKAMSANSMKTNLVLMFSGGGEVSGGTLSARSDFSATVVPTQDYADCYVAIIFFEQAYLEGTTDNPGATVQFESIKPLVGGRENKINLGFGYMDFGERRMGYFPLFFTHGIEIKSNQCEVIAQFFHRREKTIHEAIVKAYREKNPNASIPLKPYMQIPPLFPDETDFQSLPASISANFMVNEEGTVESIHFKETLPPEVSGILRRTLTGWMFLPRLKEGRPERTMVTVPMAVHRPEETTAKPVGGT